MTSFLSAHPVQRTATSTDMVLVFFQDGTAQAWYYRANIFMRRVPLLFSPEHFAAFGIPVACALHASLTD